MRKGILEVLLVHGEGIRHTNIIGKPTYYVIIQCGAQVQKSKLSSGKDEKARWNQKFKFEFPLKDWKHLTHLKFRIMDTEHFTKGGFVGETIIFLGGITAEGVNRGSLEMKPAPYNVVLEDGTYKGEIKIGLKFIINKEVIIEKRATVTQVNEPREHTCRTILNLWKSSWWKFCFYCNRLNTKDAAKKRKTRMT